MRQKKMVNTGNTLGSRTPKKVTTYISKRLYGMVTLSPEQSSLSEVLDRILDKGVVVDASVRVDLVGVDLLGINARIILSSFETAAEIGLEFPEGTNFDAPGWRDLITKQPCPICGMKSRLEDLKEHGCPWCGWNYIPNGR